MYFHFLCVSTLPQGKGITEIVAKRLVACVKIAYKDHLQPPTAQVSSVQDYVKSSTIVYR